jgi:GWxTD domain-containing protein
MPPPPPPPPDPYEKWLHEDVAYIVTSEERVTFRSLQSNAERERFIEMFWAKRDPTPGTAENEFKEEHYRRIAYSNENFADKDRAGWRSDRGRIYITYGPPDEKEVHPSGNPPYEEWLYRHIDGIGDNVIIAFDWDGSRFRMRKDPSQPRRADAIFHGLSGTEVAVTGRSAWIYVPVPAQVREHIYGWMSGEGNRHIAVLDQDAQGHVAKTLELAPGRYSLSVVHRAIPGSFVSSDHVEFAVN